jgi:hypothetical protein
VGLHRACGSSDFKLTLDRKGTRTGCAAFGCGRRLRLSPMVGQSRHRPARRPGPNIRPARACAHTQAHVRLDRFPLEAGSARLHCTGPRRCDGRGCDIGNRTFGSGLRKPHRSACSASCDTQRRPKSGKERLRACRAIARVYRATPAPHAPRPERPARCEAHQPFRLNPVRQRADQSHPSPRSRLARGRRCWRWRSNAPARIIPHA